jgi:coenzyme F420-dependent glucose-6-phosphate dehydrogenase
MDSLIDAYRAAAGDRPIHVQIAINWGSSRNAALRGAFDHWRFLVLGGDVDWELRSPADFEAATQRVRPEDLEQSVFVFSDPGS